MTSLQASEGAITDPGELRELAERLLSEGRAVSWDFETGYHGDSREKAALHPEENFVTGVSLTNSLSWARYVPVAHDTGTCMDEQAAAEILWPLLGTGRDGDGLPLGVAWGGKFELRVGRRWFSRVLGIPLDYRKFRLRSDGMLESYAEAENRQHGLKDCTALNFGHQMLQLEELFPEKLTAKQRKAIRFSVLDPGDPRVVRYACEDSLYTLAHHRRRYPKVKDSFIYRLEMAVLPVVCEMEDEGVWYDWNGMREWALKAAAFADKYMLEIRQAFAKLAGHDLDPLFNFGSSQQLARLLYDECGMPVRHRTPKGARGTDAKIALKALSKEYEPVRMYLEWKRLEKLRRDFLERFEDSYSFASDGRAHPSLMQHGVPAGRFACSDPNYQQSPRKYLYKLATGEAFEFNFRAMIGAPPGWYQLGFDLAQAELRAVAGMAREEKLLQAFGQGVDVHVVTASLLFGVPLDAVTEEQRDIGKTMGFALVYGMTEDGLADRLGITRAEAEELFAAFHAAYPRIKEWTERTIRQAAVDGYVSTWWGRKVRIWDIDSSDRRKRLEAQRTAGNAPVQGSATGDYMKIAMVRAEAALHKAGLKGDVRLAMNVHDALEWYVRDNLDPADVIRVLQSAVIFEVNGWPPMVAEWHAGRRWGTVRKLELLPDGRVRVKGGKPAEPEIEFSEDEDDVVPAPQVRPPLPAAVLPASAARPGGGNFADRPARTVIIAVTHWVPKDAIPVLVKYCRSKPGPDKVILQLPTGKAEMRETSGIGPGDEAEISVILGGAVVHYDEASADLAAVAAGVEL